METGRHPRFVLRIILGIVFSFAFWGIVRLFPIIPLNWQVPVSIGLGTFTVPILLYFFENRRHA